MITVREYKWAQVAILVLLILWFKVVHALLVKRVSCPLALKCQDHQGKDVSNDAQNSYAQETHTTDPKVCRRQEPLCMFINFIAVNALVLRCVVTWCLVQS